MEQPLHGADDRIEPAFASGPVGTCGGEARGKAVANETRFPRNTKAPLSRGLSAFLVQSSVES